ncbi:hypothetical protein GI584_08650 [Gracilibacillus salitolerans]|uniref:PspA/IM30 family protein n=1 Tax=Gracilibacillus salitolerans TaxID=2663022 RepID=A0A5Q2THD9_9BACI|nr:hypothetical protein GI584_08650 [Gracilibacillus salitolerans]
MKEVISLGLFSRAKKIIKSNIKSDQTKLHQVQKDIEQTMRELKAKVDTNRAQLHRLNQQIVEQQSKVEKFERYEEQATQQAQSNTFGLQKQQAKTEMHELETKKIGLAQKAKKLEDTYQTLQHRQGENLEYLRAMKNGAKANKQIAESLAESEKYEEQVRRELAEAEALLELREDSLQ